MTKSYGTIYGLDDPRDDTLRYIGKTSMPVRARYNGHLIAATYPTLPVHVWIAEVRASGFAPRIFVIEHVRLADLDAAEKKWIAHYIAAGANLTNVRDGGTTPRLSARRTDEEKLAARYGIPVDSICGGSKSPKNKA